MPRCCSTLLVHWVSLDTQLRAAAVPSTRRLHQYPRVDGCVPRRAPSQVTVFETVIELENVTSTQNVSVLINETVRYNATYNVTYDVLRNVTYDVTFNETYNARSRRGERHRGLNAVDARSTTHRRRSHTTRPSTSRSTSTSRKK